MFKILTGNSMADLADQQTRRRLGWPINDLDVGQGFVIPIQQGKDPDGRPVRHLYTYASKAAKRLGRKFQTTKLSNGDIAIKRTA